MQKEVDRTGLNLWDMEAIAIGLTSDEMAKKDRAMRSYKTQLPILRLDPGDVDRWRAVLAHEVAWKVLLEDLRGEG